VTYLALCKNIPLTDTSKLKAMCKGMKINFEQKGRGQTSVFVDGMDVTNQIRTPERR